MNPTQFKVLDLATMDSGISTAASEPIAKSGPKLHLTTLPAEIHLHIFDELDDDPATAACLGITCKTFYPLFRARHDLVLFRDPKPLLLGLIMRGSMPEEGPIFQYFYRLSRMLLPHQLLSNWMPPHLVFCEDRVFLKFVTRERELEIRRAREIGGRELDDLKQKEMERRQRKAS